MWKSETSYSVYRNFHDKWRRLHAARGARAPPPTFTNGWAWGHHEQENSKEETEQTALNITKSLTETTNCTFRSTKVEGHD